MGVMVCDRTGCENILCDVLIDNQYVCSSCLEEFRERMEQELGDEEILHADMLDKFREFMNTQRREGGSRRTTINTFIRYYTRSRYDEDD